MSAKTPKPGIYKNIDFEEYLSWNCFHKSMVSNILRSGKHLEHHINNVQNTSKQMNFGTLVEILLLEPKKFDNSIVVRPEFYENDKGEIKPWNNNANVCKSWNEKNSDSIVIKQDELDSAKTIVNKINAHDQSVEWLKDSEKQISIVWVDSSTGVLCKGRIDILKDNYIVDLKTTRDAGLTGFQCNINNFLYHVQAAMYVDGYKELTGEDFPFGFIVAETEPPFCIANYIMGPISMETGRSIYKRALNRYKSYLEFGPVGYSKFAEEIEIPNWAVMMEENKDV